MITEATIAQIEKHEEYRLLICPITLEIINDPNVKCVKLGTRFYTLTLLKTALQTDINKFYRAIDSNQYYELRAPTKEPLPDDLFALINVAPDKRNFATVEAYLDRLSIVSTKQYKDMLDKAVKVVNAEIAKTKEKAKDQPKTLAPAPSQAAVRSQEVLPSQARVSIERSPLRQTQSVFHPPRLVLRQHSEAVASGSVPEIRRVTEPLHNTLIAEPESPVVVQSQQNEIPKPVNTEAAKSPEQKGKVITAQIKQSFNQHYKLYGISSAVVFGSFASAALFVGVGGLQVMANSSVAAISNFAASILSLGTMGAISVIGVVLLALASTVILAGLGIRYYYSSPVIANTKEAEPILQATHQSVQERLQETPGKERLSMAVDAEALSESRAEPQPVDDQKNIDLHVNEAGASVTRPRSVF